MITVPQKVEEYITKSPFIKMMISEGIINLSQFARSIKPQLEVELKKTISDASIIMSLKRISEQLRFAKKIDYRNHLGDITLKSGLIELTFKNSKTLNRHLESLLNKTSDEEYVTFVKGAWQTTLILSKTLEQTVKSIFSTELQESEFTQLSSITINLINQHIEEPGVVAYILNVLAWQGVNIIEVVSTFSELTVIIEDKDVQNAFGIIHGLKRV